MFVISLFPVALYCHKLYFTGDVKIETDDMLIVDLHIDTMMHIGIEKFFLKMIKF